MKFTLLQEEKLLTIGFILLAYVFWFVFPALFIGIEDGLIVSGIMGTFYTIRILWCWIKPA